MVFLLSSLTLLSTLVTTFAGSSLRKSTASSTLSSFIIVSTSLSVTEFTISSCISLSIYAKVSAALSFVSRRKTSILLSSGISSKNSARLGAFSSFISSLSFAYFPSLSSSSHSLKSLLLSSIFRLPPFLF